LVDQNTSLKKEAGIAERKLLARNERIQNLEAMLQDADRRLSHQNQKFEAQLAAVKERLDQARGQRSFYFFPSLFWQPLFPIRVKLKQLISFLFLLTLLFLYLRCLQIIIVSVAIDIGANIYS
jgi:hypothetical protein